MKASTIFIISGLFLIILGCNKKEDSVYYYGNIVGFGSLTDEFGKEVQNKSGIKIQIENTSYKSSTNVNGRFELTNIPAGSYNIIYSKDGFGVYKIFSFQFIGGNIPALLYENTLYQIPGIEIQNPNVSIENNVIHISGTLPETNSYSVKTFINDSSNVSNLIFDFSSIRESVYSNNITHFDQYINLSETPYLAGETIYIAIYFINPYEHLGYWDYEEDNLLYTSYKKAADVINLVIE